MLSIDWEKASTKPYAKQKVLGSFLLNLKSKIEELEEKLEGSNKNDESKVKVYSDKTEAMEKIIMDKNEVIEKLESNYEKRLLEIGKLKGRIDELENLLVKAKTAPELITKLQNMLLHKGFVADKEFYQLLNKMEQKYTSIDF
ncbi:MAG: hypothetical protein ACFFAO_05145 [Candidatus Hermodarchaeota archaeon]